MNPDLARLAAILAEERTEAYYVGGCVRDCLLGQPVKDVDLAVAGRTWPLAGRLARALHGSPFWLREADQVARVIVPESGLSVDLSPLGGSITEDLLARDLTINSLAIAASHPLSPASPLLDPAGGQGDLSRRLIRFTRPDAVERDPLRSLRALRFRYRLGFRLAPGTAALIRRGITLLPRVSAERIRDELFMMLTQESAPQAIEATIRAGLGPPLFPKRDASPGEGVAAAVRQALARLGSVVRAAGGLPEAPDIADHLAEIPIQYRSRLALLRWTLLQGVGQDLLVGEALGGTLTDPARGKEFAVRHGPLDQAGDALRLSVRERQLARHAVAGAAALVQVLGKWPAAGSARLAAFEAARGAEVEAVLLAACHSGFQEPARELLREALRRHGDPDRPLLDGCEVMGLLHLKPGPEVGRILAELRRAAADGLIGTPEEARRWLLEHYGTGGSC